MDVLLLLCIQASVQDDLHKAILLLSPAKLAVGNSTNQATKR